VAVRLWVFGAGDGERGEIDVAFQATHGFNP
jgi:hypothetical protein